MFRWADHKKITKAKINKRRYFLRKVTKLHVDKTLITLFYKSIVQSVLSFCIAAWGGDCGVQDRKAFGRMINRAGKFIRHIFIRYFLRVITAEDK